MAMPANSGGLDQFEEGKSAGGHASEVEVPEGIIGSAAVTPTPAATINPGDKGSDHLSPAGVETGVLHHLPQTSLVTFRADLASIIMVPCERINPLMRLGRRLFHSDKLEGSRGFEFRVPNVFQCVPVQTVAGSLGYHRHYRRRGRASRAEFRGGYWVRARFGDFITPWIEGWELERVG
jgi:hypothetical protein